MIQRFTAKAANATLYILPDVKKKPLKHLMV